MSPKDRQTTPNFDVLRAQHAPMGSPDLDWCACGIPWPCDFIRADDERRKLREAAQPILDRCLDFFGPDDLDPESSEAMPVVIKNRWVYALLAALDEVKP